MQQQHTLYKNDVSVITNSVLGTSLVKFCVIFVGLVLVFNGAWSLVSLSRKLKNVFEWKLIVDSNKHDDWNNQVEQNIIWMLLLTLFILNSYYIGENIRLNR